MIKLKLIWKKYWVAVCLITITLLSLLARMHQLDNLPSILNRDEAALAYNAFLINQTGEDEWHRAWPINFESFGDYKLPGYIYTLAGLFALMTPSDWLVRMPSVLAGTLLPLLSYFLARNLKYSRPWSLLLSVLVATSPVFFYFSRVAFEANLALTLFVATWVLWLRSQPNWKTDLLGALLLGLAVFTYNTPLLLLPMLLPMLLLYRGLKRPKSWWLVLVCSIIFFSLGAWSLWPVSAQKSNITIFNDETTWAKYLSYRQQFDQPWQSLLGNRYVYSAEIMTRHAFDSLRPGFLIRGTIGHPWHGIPNHGHLLPLTYVFMLAGLFLVSAFIIKNFNWRATQTYKRQLLILYFFIVSWLPAVVTVDAPHATRSLFALFMANVLALVAIKTTYHFLRDNSQVKKQALAVIFGLVLIGFTSDYLYDYFGKYPSQQQALKPGFEEIINQVNSRNNIAVVDGEGYQYILLAWYLRIPPETFFATTVRQLPDKIGFKYGERVNQYHFIVDERDRSEKETILVSWDKDEHHWLIEEF